MRVIQQRDRREREFFAGLMELSVMSRSLLDPGRTGRPGRLPLPAQAFCQHALAWIAAPCEAASR